MLVATPGDHLIIRGHRVGEPERDAEIVEVRGPDGTPPFLVRWSGDGHESLVFPGSDALVRHEHRDDQDQDDQDQ
ncbi:DUF1918 domain-containing protein [Ilumatobacter sp.]|uniref:DUF1918 domain-containing protein n=1 Tax=Ilumatobacter sp. TaxID=1967498 RepID=UPI003AF70E67